MPARTGAEYIKGLKEHPPEVYLNGKKVKDITSHPGLRNGVQTGNPMYPYFFSSPEPFTPHHSFRAEIEQRLDGGASAGRLLRHLAEGPAQLLTTGVGVAPITGVAFSSWYSRSRVSRVSPMWDDAGSGSR